MNKLKELRIKNNFTQEKLAYETGVTVRYIAFLESGDRKPSLELAGKIAEKLHATVDEIFLPSKCTKCTSKKKKEALSNNAG